MVPGAPGGIRRLCELIDEYGDELEADFRQFYGLRLADVFRGLLSPRDAIVLAGQLGTIPYSRFRARALGVDGLMGWSRTEDLLADAIDAIQSAAVGIARSNGAKAKAPDPYPRPHMTREEELVDVPSIDDFPIHLVVAMTTKK